MIRAGIVAICATIAAEAAWSQGTVTDPEAWRSHVTGDLMPYWGQPDALGTPVGSFPGRRCNDGTAPTPGVACGGVTAGQASDQRQTLVGHARQVFGYAVAFHMTGDERYLDWAEAGAQYQLDTFYDAGTGLFADYYDPITTTASAIGTSSQKQAYGLSGLNFLYHVTGDAALGQRLTEIEATFATTYRDAATGAYREAVGDTQVSLRIEAHLDQLNTYKVGLADLGPTAERARHLAEARETMDYIVDTFYDASTGFFKALSTDPDGSLANVDLGHNIKTLWFMDQIAELTGDPALADFARTTADRVFDAAWDPVNGHWISKFDSTGTVSPTAVWWVSAEMNQYLAALAIDRPELRARLDAAQATWLNELTDGIDGGNWAEVDRATGVANTVIGKHSEWVNAFHSFEHALLQMMGAAGMSDEDLTLYFARDGAAGPFDLSYGFTAAGASVTPHAGASPLQAVTFSGIDYGTQNAAVVPLPATAGLLAMGLGIAAGLRRRYASSSASQ